MLKKKYDTVENIKSISMWIKKTNKYLKSIPATITHIMDRLNNYTLESLYYIFKKPQLMLTIYLVPSYKTRNISGLSLNKKTKLISLTLEKKRYSLKINLQRSNSNLHSYQPSQVRVLKYLIKETLEKYKVVKP